MAKRGNRTGRVKSAEAGMTAISVRGYKSIREERRIELRPLTILAGANSSGKSSIMQPLLLLKQTLETPYDPGPLLLDGANVQITSADQVLSRIAGQESADSFSVELEMARRVRLGLRFNRALDKGFDIHSMSYANGAGGELELRPNMSPDELRRVLSPEVAVELRSIETGIKERVQLEVLRNRCFLSVFAVVRGEPAIRLGLQMFPEQLGPSIEKIIHVPGLRGNPERTYKASAVGEDFAGRFQDYVASVISHWQDSCEDGRLEQLGRSLEELGLTWKIRAKRVDATRVELRVGRMPHGQRGGARDLVCIADVGFGISQTLPVLVALLVANRGHMVYLEQPEIHLHPRAQRSMAAALAAAAKRGVKVVAETHSSLLLRGVQTLVAKAELPRELVKLHWFTRSPQDGATEVHSADLDERGRFGEGWPEDFDEVLLGAESEYLDAVEAHR